MKSLNSRWMGQRPKEPKTDFGKHLLHLRLEAGLKQSEIAEHLGVSGASYSSWERTGELPGKEVIPKLAEILGISLEQLLDLKQADGTHRGPKSDLERAVEDAKTLTKEQRLHIARVLRELIDGIRQADLRNKV